ncbi:23S rRNA (uracil(1939)-C(5))-methyltransferase RlmD [Staphylococcus succinus]|uniref:23S rRNA (uracil(1939)-C(5))-methyltransferase RlmD n=1 Tax=Staphylococcus succinus TaxID=61015 RepID=UPI00062B4C59|nr:23S rRNA (uracil(1939)-C(5))-methyltransferase RlmD [Staphylococcus succinus]MDH9161500.1 23S rRNA (uracil(1939)-C(5))-methyltransferase RlmD [Staphylococcus succinus]PNZ16729.1 23S rRNA (uracil(1939)-C(5))-methyltransferase RlmD [Staphylococcus succinus subsp. succinus]RIN25322.1 23S rRNA (uracil(1939)-C(5))-methyltransferase RlmD [Staphylococcus succinus]RIN45177.1 23S rRNA (uracil(1939)-C(5))-methyltransferase RlmD [Staphylococcus succinus]
MNVIEKNEVREGQVIDLTHEGHGVVKLDRYPIFIPNALINETIEYKVIKVKKNFAIGKLIDIKAKSEERVEPPCVYYYKCGGCQLQHMTYQAQLNMKKEQVINLFQRKAGFKDTVIHDTVGMDNPWYYRNKSQIPVGKNDEQNVIMGYYRQRSHQIIDMDECLIQDNIHQDVMNKIKLWFNELNVSTYNEHKKQGLMRHVVIRTGHHSGELMVVFVTNGKKFKQSAIMVEKLLTAFPNIVSIKHNINDTHSNVIMGQTSYTLYGKDEIQDTLSDVTFKINDQSFYQINSVQTEKLYQKAIDYAELQGEETVLDTYCGIGTIGLYMAPKAKHVYGVEIVAEAIADAQQNATLNQFENTTFVCGKAEEVILKWKADGIKPDVVMVDPPRKGCDESFLDTLLELNPRKIVYISCNPSTQQRDAQQLATQYKLTQITPVDMFPHTTHVETVAQFERR